MNQLVLPRVAVIGAGAVGCTVAARLAAAGCHVTVCARGAAVEAIRRNGVRLRLQDGELSGGVAVAETPWGCEPVDVVVIAVKQQDLDAVAAHWLQGPLEAGTIIPAINGIPWWFLSALGHPLASSPVAAIGQRGPLHERISLERILACVVYITAYSPEPGVAVQGARNGLIFGEPAGGASMRLENIVQACRLAGFEASASGSIHRDIWTKAVGNAVFNPLSVLAHADMHTLATDPYIGELAHDMLHECMELGRRLGIEPEMTARQRLMNGASAGRARTSMLQDYLKGKPLEVEALVGAMVQLGELAGMELPSMRGVYGLVRHKSSNNPFNAPEGEHAKRRQT